MNKYKIEGLILSDLICVNFVDNEIYTNPEKGMGVRNAKA